MNLTEARTSLKELAEAILLLNSASIGIKDSDFQALQKQKDSLETSLAELHKKVKTESDAANLEIANAQAAAKEKKAALTAEIARLEARTTEIEAQAIKSREAIRNELREYRAKEIAAKNLELKQVTEAAVSARRILDDINAQVEAGRKRFA